MAGKLFIVLALVFMLGQTYGRSADIEEFLNDVVDTPDADIEKLFEEHLSKFDDLESMFKEDPSADVDTSNDIELEADEQLGGCRRGVCNFCIKKFFLRACFTARYLKKKIGFEMKVTINGKRMFKKEISVRNPPPICVNKIPGLSKLGNICIQVYNVNLRRKSACVRIRFKIKLGWIRKTFNIKIKCFRLPILAEDEMMEEYPDMDGLTYQ